MSFSQFFVKQFIANFAREWNIQYTIAVQMSDFGISETEFLATETMWVDGHLLPPGYFILKLLQVNVVSAVFQRRLEGTLGLPE